MKREATIGLPQFVTFIEASQSDWKSDARECFEEGFNLFVLLPPDVSEQQLADALGVGLGDLPLPLTKAGLLSYSRFVDPAVFRLPEMQEHGKERVFYVEQINLPQTRPPHVKPFLLYCHIRGIISQHEIGSDARVACDNYNSDHALRRQFPDAAVYRWETTEWRRTRLC